MKRMAVLLCGFVTLVAGAGPARAQHTLESQLDASLNKARALSSGAAAMNTIVKGNVTYSGIGVSLFKTDNLLQLCNPLAPAKYGNGEENVLRVGSTGRLYAWKLLSIRF
jgi:hypothetical protein